MTQLLKILPLFAALAAAPAFAADPDPHAGHHPAAAADAAKPAAATPKGDEKAAMRPCPMMDGKMAAGAGPMAGKGPDGKLMAGKMMMDGKDMHCMPAAPTAKAPDAPHDHEHPDAAAPK
jgi:hypothetical protein